MGTKGNQSGRALPSGYLLHHRYLLKRMLGEGGFGITYEAWDQKENCRVAVKEYMPQGMTARASRTGKVTAIGDKAHYEKYLERFLDEAQIIYRYRNHPNIVEVRHLFRANNTAYYAMEYLCGSDLRHMLMRSGCLSWEMVRSIFGQVASALHTVHQGGIIHCDISPDNMIMLDGGLVKLIDFGAAKTNVGGNSTMVILKQGYAPPEQYISHGKLGPWTDVYAMAVTIYHCLTGKMPPKSIDRIAKDKLIPPSALVSLPAGFREDVLLKALSPRVEQRYQDVRTFWNALAGGAAWSLTGRAGVWEGRKTALKSVVYAGKASGCQIRFPAHTPGVGRRHFRIWQENGKLYIMDLGSGYGTFVEYRRLTPGLIYELKRGYGIRIGDNQIFEVSVN